MITKEYRQGNKIDIESLCCWPDVDVTIVTRYYRDDVKISTHHIDLEGLSRVEFDRFIEELKAAYDRAEKWNTDYANDCARLVELEGAVDNADNQNNGATTINLHTV